MKKEIQTIIGRKINIIAKIVNKMFLDSEYKGKDWEQVRQDLILELMDYFSQEKAKERQKFIEILEGLKMKKYYWAERITKEEKELIELFNKDIEIQNQKIQEAIEAIKK